MLPDETIFIPGTSPVKSPVHKKSSLSGGDSALSSFLLYTPHLSQIANDFYWIQRSCSPRVLRRLGSVLSTSNNFRSPCRHAAERRWAIDLAARVVVD